MSRTQLLMSRSCRELLCSLGLLIFVFRALIPVGFMPVFESGGHGHITICSGYETKVVETEGQLHKNAPSAEMPCGFSVNAAGGFAEPAFSIIPTLTVETANHTLRDDYLPAVSRHAPYGSRAPPSA